MLMNRAGLTGYAVKYGDKFLGSLLLTSGGQAGGPTPADTAGTAWRTDSQAKAKAIAAYLDGELVEVECYELNPSGALGWRVVQKV